MVGITYISDSLMANRMGGIMSYWGGSGIDSYEEDRNLYCEECDETYDDVPCMIEGSSGMGTCPGCNREIEFEV